MDYFPKREKFSGASASMAKEKGRLKWRPFLVEIVGVEPTTPCLQSRCTSQLSYTPVVECKYRHFFYLCSLQQKKTKK